VPAGGRRWGWHALDAREAARLVATAGVGPGDLVVDAGAGSGALTAPLVGAGARVVAVELHPARAAALRRRFAGDPVTVVRADVADLRLPRSPFAVVANPPFAASAALLRRLTAPGSRLVAAHLVLPTWVARRWAGGGAPGAGRWQATYRALVLHRVPRSSFTPAPPGDAAVLEIRRRDEPATAGAAAAAGGRPPSRRRSRG
jgi:23S rRNA (adenine-N6)-dimethyltransferase